MKIKNIAEKIINVGAVVILPGAVAEDVPDAYAKLPSIDALKRMNLIEVFDVAEEPAEADDAPVAEEPKRRGRKAAVAE